MINFKPGEYIDIGSELSDEIEYLGEKDTTYTEDGKLYASNSGYLSIDEKARMISIETKNNESRIIPKDGDIIVGMVQHIRKQSIGIYLKVINNNIINFCKDYANIHISSISNDYIKNIKDFFSKNDIVRAKIMGKKWGEWRVSTKGSKFGVIHSQCIYCGHPYEKMFKKRNKVKCNFCGHQEKKKIASDFGNIKEKYNIR